ncbi:MULTISPECIES: phosphotransferase [unclassified Photobacterium]|uniref:phosphotransferase n=1 Tax=unclassified Photobacterium TaxID=2628852 RepID=UPI001EDCC542|nr:MULTISPECIES: phosphotransferase [unclassified Photobacterium]MCG3863641.1 phosphotransferase [Photobacterium sp. Ph6]MCG3875170.1 phosphotransferase [Photobacterium sp. Ph5]
MKDNELFDPTLLSLLPDTEFLTASPLAGGLTNRCWKLSLYHPSKKQSAHYVWRPLTTITQVFGVNRTLEYQLLRIVEDSELAPKPYALLDTNSNNNDQVLIVDWLEGEQADQRFTDQQLCQLQARIHALPLPTHRLDIKQRIEHYWQTIPDDLKSKQLMSIYHYFDKQKISNYFPDTCCHFDLGRYNIIVQNRGRESHFALDNAKVIDWEYASAGDPSFDLTMTILANALSPEKAVQDYCLAREESDITLVSTEVLKWLEAVNYWQPWCEYLALLWYLVGYQVWHDDEYLRQAKQLELKLKQMAT